MYSASHIPALGALRRRGTVSCQQGSPRAGAPATGSFEDV